MKKIEKILKLTGEAVVANMPIFSSYGFSRIGGTLNFIAFGKIGELSIPLTLTLQKTISTFKGIYNIGDSETVVIDTLDKIFYLDLEIVPLFDNLKISTSGGSLGDRINLMLLLE